MSGFARKSRYTLPHLTTQRTHAHGIEILSGTYCAGNVDAGVFPRYVTRFRCADGIHYTHVGSARKVADANGKKVWAGPAALTPGASVSLRIDGRTYNPDGDIVTSVRKLARP
jgi:hypothetical protein